MLEKAGGARADEEPLQNPLGRMNIKQRDDSAVPGAGHSVVCAERLREFHGRSNPEAPCDQCLYRTEQAEL